MTTASTRAAASSVSARCWGTRGHPGKGDWHLFGSAKRCRSPFPDFSGSGIQSGASDDLLRPSPPTIEFRLPDGSAHPFTLLAGVAQAMAGAPGADEAEPLLERTAAARAAHAAGSVPKLPLSFGEIASALAECRPVLERGAVFPARMLDEAIDALRR